VPSTSGPAASASSARISTDSWPAEPTAPAADEQTTTDPLREARQRLDPALQRARDALAADRKSDLAAALSMMVDAVEDAIATLERSAFSPPPDPPGQQLVDERNPML